MFPFQSAISYSIIISGITLALNKIYKEKEHIFLRCMSTVFVVRFWTTQNDSSLFRDVSWNELKEVWTSILSNSSMEFRQFKRFSNH